MSEPRQIRLKRLAMRSMRRGIREMDLILQDFSQREMAGLSAGELDDFEALLAENDHDLYAWVSGSGAPPERFAALVARLSQGARGLTRPGRDSP